MKKIIIPLVVLLGTIGAKAQTGIGTPLPHGTAELEVSSKNKGVLIPRVELVNESDTKTVNGGVYPESLMVYNTGVGVSQIEAGFYFWNKTKWSALISNSTLYKYIKETAKDGNVTITTIDGKDFTFTWVDKTTDKEESTTLSALIKSLETDTPIVPTTKKVGETLVNTGEYKYKSERSKEITINVVDDVANNFDKVINNNEFKTVFNKYLNENVEGNVTYKNEKFYYTVKNLDGTFTNKEIELKELIKENSVLAELILTDASKNKEEVVGGFTFSNGKDKTKDVQFAETLTSFSKGDDAVKGEGFIAYNYKDETGKIAKTQITITSDVIKSFEKIINDPTVENHLNNFISGATGSVTVTKKDNGDIVIGYKNGNKVEEVNLTDLIAEKETKTTITVGEVAPGGKRTGVYTYKNEEKVDVQITVVDDVTNNFDKIINNKSVQDIINNYLKDNALGNVTYEGGKFYYVKNEEGVIKKEEIEFSGIVKANETLTSIKEVVAGNAGQYVYKDEKSASSIIDIVKGVTDNSKTIFENKTVIDKIIEQIKENAKPGTVTVIGNEKDNNLVFEWKDKDGGSHSVDLKTLVREFETLTVLSFKDTAKQNVILNYKDEKGTIGDLDISAALTNSETFKNFLKGYIIDEGGKETVTEIKKMNAAGVEVAIATKPANGMTFYEYENEKKEKRYITVSQDVSDDFSKIIENNKTILENLIKTTGGNASVARKGEDIIITNVETKEEFNLTTEIVNKQKFTEVALVAGQLGTKGKGVTITTNKANTTATTFEESLTKVDRYNAKGVLENITTATPDLTYYEYLDESGKKQYITVSQDVSNDFSKIVENNKTVIENISKGTNLYSTVKETIVGQFNDKDVLRYTVELKQNNSFMAIELPKAINGMILEAILINKDTNSIVRGVVGKKVNGDKTVLTIGTVGTIMSNNPSGSYCVIVEYVKQ